MGLKNKMFDLRTDGFFAVRAARHLWTNRVEKGLAACRGANFFRMNPTADMLDEMKQERYEQRDVPTGMKKRGNFR